MAEVTDPSIASVDPSFTSDSDVLPFTLRGLQSGTAEVIARTPDLGAITRSFTVETVARTALSIAQPYGYMIQEITEDPNLPGDEPKILTHSTIAVFQRHFSASGDQLFGAADWGVDGPLGTRIEQVKQTFVPSPREYVGIDETPITVRENLTTGTSTGPATITTAVGGTFGFEVVDLDAVENVYWGSHDDPLPTQFVFDQPEVGLVVVANPEGAGGVRILGEGPPISITRIDESPSDGSEQMVVDFNTNYRAIELYALTPGTVTLRFEWAGFQTVIDIVVLASAIRPPFVD